MTVKDANSQSQKALARQEYKKRWREANRERIRETDRKWREANPDKVAAAQHRYWAKRLAQLEGN